MNDILTWLIPLVAPREARLGEELAIKMKTAPVAQTSALVAAPYDTGHDGRANHNKMLEK